MPPATPAGRSFAIILLMEELRKIKLNIPSWAAVLYIVISLGLIPWTVYLSFALPDHHLSRNWDITWVGLDAALIGSLLATGILARLKSIYMIATAVITGTLFTTDAWFDILSYRAGTRGFNEAVVMALIGEIPMAVMSFALAVHGLRRLHAAANK
jgi:hypothetical protein